MLTTPFGDIVREQVRRQSGLTMVRFVAYHVPTFVRVVNMYDARHVTAGRLSDRTLDNIIEAIRKDVFGVMSLFDQSGTELSVKAASPPGRSRPARVESTH